jgi:hypothetical protein
MKMNFGLQKFHEWSYTELEEMLPWERTIYVAQVMHYVQEEKANRDRKK